MEHLLPEGHLAGFDCDTSKYFSSVFWDGIKPDKTVCILFTKDGFNDFAPLKNLKSKFFNVMGVEHNGKYIFVAEYDHHQIAKSTIEVPKDLAEMKKALNNFIHSITAKTQQ